MNKKYFYYSILLTTFCCTSQVLSMETNNEKNAKNKCFIIHNSYTEIPFAGEKKSIQKLLYNRNFINQTGLIRYNNNKFTRPKNISNLTNEDINSGNTTYLHNCTQWLIKGKFKTLNYIVVGTTDYKILELLFLKTHR